MFYSVEFYSVERDLNNIFTKQNLFSFLINKENNSLINTENKLIILNELKNLFKYFKPIEFDDNEFFIIYLLNKIKKQSQNELINNLFSLLVNFNFKNIKNLEKIYFSEEDLNKKIEFNKITKEIINSLYTFLNEKSHNKYILNLVIEEFNKKLSQELLEKSLNSITILKSPYEKLIEIFKKQLNKSFDEDTIDNLIKEIKKPMDQLRLNENIIEIIKSFLYELSKLNRKSNNNIKESLEEMEEDNVSIIVNAALNTKDLKILKKRMIIFVQAFHSLDIIFNQDEKDNFQETFNSIIKHLEDLKKHFLKDIFLNNFFNILLKKNNIKLLSNRIFNFLKSSENRESFSEEKLKKLLNNENSKDNLLENELIKNLTFVFNILNTQKNNIILSDVPTMEIESLIKFFLIKFNNEKFQQIEETTINEFNQKLTQLENQNEKMSNITNDLFYFLKNPSNKIYIINLVLAKSIEKLNQLNKENKKFQITINTENKIINSLMKNNNQNTFETIENFIKKLNEIQDTIKQQEDMNSKIKEFKEDLLNDKIDIQKCLNDLQIENFIYNPIEELNEDNLFNLTENIYDFLKLKFKKSKEEKSKEEKLKEEKLKEENLIYKNFLQEEKNKKNINEIVISRIINNYLNRENIDFLSEIISNNIKKNKFDNILNKTEEQKIKNKINLIIRNSLNDFKQSKEINKSINKENDLTLIIYNFFHKLNENPISLIIKNNLSSLKSILKTFNHQVDFYKNIKILASFFNYLSKQNLNTIEKYENVNFIYNLFLDAFLTYIYFCFNNTKDAIYYGVVYMENYGLNKNKQFFLKDFVNYEDFKNEKYINKFNENLFEVYLKILRVNFMHHEQNEIICDLPTAMLFLLFSFYKKEKNELFYNFNLFIEKYFQLLKQKEKKNYLNLLKSFITEIAVSNFSLEELSIYNFLSEIKTNLNKNINDLSGMTIEKIIDLNLKFIVLLYAIDFYYFNISKISKKILEQPKENIYKQIFNKLFQDLLNSKTENIPKNLKIIDKEKITSISEYNSFSYIQYNENEFLKTNQVVQKRIDEIANLEKYNIIFTNFSCNKNSKNIVVIEQDYSFNVSEYFSKPTENNIKSSTIFQFLNPFSRAIPVDECPYYIQRNSSSKCMKKKSLVFYDSKSELFNDTFRNSFYFKCLHEIINNQFIDSKESTQFYKSFIKEMNNSYNIILSKLHQDLKENDDSILLFNKLKGFVKKSSCLKK
jgi:hypothetical protein